MSRISKVFLSFLAPGLIGLIFLASHLFQLTKLPVFADEAIYIRWSQLIIDDAQRYAFFSLNDGKTPLFIWLQVPFQNLLSDPLWAGRLVAVLAGFGTIFVILALVKELGLSRNWQYVAAGAMTVWPFWFFHHRMALMDGLLVFWLALSWLCLLRALKTTNYVWALAAGLSFGLSLMTKLPAILFLPSLGLVIIQGYLLNQPQPSLGNFMNKFKNWLPLMMLGVTSSLGIFLLLKLHPAFSQLFSRGGDFLFKLPELTAVQIWHNFWANGTNFSVIFGHYLTWGALSLLIIGLFTPKRRQMIGLLLFMSLSFMLPIQIMGKVIYARYLLPAALPLTLAIILAIESLVARINLEKKLVVRTGLATILAVLLAQSLTQSSRFMIYSWLNPNALDLTLSDQVQYLTEWSSGNGLKEVANAALTVNKSQSLLILTEGFFGTLPDGLLMYFHQQKLGNIFVEGIGQPVREIPEKMIEKSKNYDQTWLVVNSHRMKISLPPDQLLGQYCRLPGYPCLQIWNLKPYIKVLSP